MQDMDARFEKMEQQLRQWGAMLEALAAKTMHTGADAAQRHGKLVDELKVKHEAARAKVAELRAAGAEKWDSLKAGADSVWNELEGAFRNLRA